jgi:hypothetical protein
LREDLQIGVDDAGRWVVLLKQLVQCGRNVKASAALNALATDGASLAQKLGHGDALQTATWGNHNKQRMCEVRLVAAVLEWAVEGYGGINVLGPEQRAELAAAVQKTACDHQRPFVQADEEDTDADRVQRMFEDDFKGNL